MAEKDEVQPRTGTANELKDAFSHAVEVIADQALDLFLGDHTGAETKAETEVEEVDAEGGRQGRSRSRSNKASGRSTRSTSVKRGGATKSKTAPRSSSVPAAKKGSGTSESKKKKFSFFSRGKKSKENAAEKEKALTELKALQNLENDHNRIDLRSSLVLIGELLDDFGLTDETCKGSTFAEDVDDKVNTWIASIKNNTLVPDKEDRNDETLAVEADKKVEVDKRDASEPKAIEVDESIARRPLNTKKAKKKNIEPLQLKAMAKATAIIDSQKSSTKSKPVKKAVKKAKKSKDKREINILSFASPTGKNNGQEMLLVTEKEDPMDAVTSMMDFKGFDQHSVSHMGDDITWVDETYYRAEF